MNECMKCGYEYELTDPWNPTINFCAECTEYICNEIDINDKCTNCAAPMELSWVEDFKSFHCCCTGCSETDFFITDKDKIEKLKKFFKMVVVKNV